MLGNWAARAKPAGEVSPQRSSPTLLPCGPAKGVRKEKAVTPVLQYRGVHERPLDFLSHLSREQQKGQGEAALQLRHLLTGRTTSLNDQKAW